MSCLNRLTFWCLSVLLSNLKSSARRKADISLWQVQWVNSLIEDSGSQGLCLIIEGSICSAWFTFHADKVMSPSWSLDRFCPALLLCLPNICSHVYVRSCSVSAPVLLIQINRVMNNDLPSFSVSCLCISPTPAE